MTSGLRAGAGDLRRLASFVDQRGADATTVIAYVSQVATLEPGDLILTGTPARVGQSRTPPRWLQPGDVVHTSVDGIGALRNVVRAHPE